MEVSFLKTAPRIPACKTDVKPNMMMMMVKVNKMQFAFMPGTRTVDAVFILRRLQEEEKKLYIMCFVDLEKAFDRVPRKVVE